ncbi:MAG: hypothetical protein HOW73_50020 [Polyangiaceae bacterium]|nr:hypothetical protein [Polyangiaceae bacterium]
MPTQQASFVTRLARLAPLSVALVLGCQSREEKAVELVESLATVFEKHGNGDCAVLADRLEGALVGKDDALAALAESDANKEARKRSAKYQQRIDAAFQKIVDNSRMCGKEPRVGAVLAKIL